MGQQWLLDTCSNLVFHSGKNLVNFLCEASLNAMPPTQICRLIATFFQTFVKLGGGETTLHAVIISDIYCEVLKLSVTRHKLLFS